MGNLDLIDLIENEENLVESQNCEFTTPNVRKHTVSYGFEQNL